jgi:hypothetical protein
VVVKEALGHVQHLFRRQTNARQGLPKVVQRRLLALDLLCSDDPIERDAELLIGAGKQVVVGVGDDRQRSGGYPLVETTSSDPHEIMSSRFEFQRGLSVRCSPIGQEEPKMFIERPEAIAGYSPGRKISRRGALP